MRGADPDLTSKILFFPMTAGSPAQKSTPVFVVGFNKTGTTSMAELLNAWGYKAFHGVGWSTNLDHFSFKEHDAFTDGERHDFEGLDKAYSDAKFIVLLRSLDRWLVSRIMYVEYRRHINKTGWMRKEYEADPDQAVRQWILRRNDYYQRLSAYFSDRPDKLIAVNLCEVDDPKGITRAVADHLGVTPAEELSFPVRNAAQSNRNELNWQSKAAAWFRGVRLRQKSEVEEEIGLIFKSVGLDKTQQRSDGSELFLAHQCPAALVE